jgi:TDG/mug DNA glycosylase family protein
VKCLPPVFGENPKVLILGSMPGGESLRTGQYYAYKHNRFWKVIFDYFNLPVTGDYNEKQTVLKTNHIALWDTIKCCQRQDSSLDSKITDVVPNDISEFLSENPSIDTIFLNGGKAKEIFKKNVKLTVKINVKALPSTSPANAAKPYNQIYREWKIALDGALL